MKRLLAAVACSLALAACSDDSSSTADPPSPTTSAPSDPTSSPTEVGESPEEFVRRWVEVSTQMQNTGETRDYLAISSKCRACKAVAEQVAGYFDAGGYVKTDGWTIDSLRLSSADGQGRVTATIHVTSAPTEYKESADSEVQTLKGGEVIELMTIQPADRSWVVFDLEQQAQ